MFEYNLHRKCLPHISPSTRFFQFGCPPPFQPSQPRSSFWHWTLLWIRPPWWLLVVGLFVVTQVQTVSPTTGAKNLVGATVLILHGSNVFTHRFYYSFSTPCDLPARGLLVLKLMLMLGPCVSHLAWLLHVTCVVPLPLHQ